MICIMLILDPRSTALVLIDLQNGIIGTPLAPRSGRDVLATTTAFARRFRAAGAPVVLVHFALADDYADALRQPVDQPTPLPAGGLPAGWRTWAAASQKRAISASPNGNGAPSTVRNWTSSFDAEASGRSY